MENLDISVAARYEFNRLQNVYLYINDYLIK